MPNYQHGKIYQIIAPNGSKYIGSTTRPLSIRFSTHKSDYKRYIEKKIQKCSSSLQLFEAFPHDALKIELIENYPCCSRFELNKREGELIKLNDCINKRIEGRTTIEYTKDTKEKRKLNRINNLEIYKAKNKEYYNKNCEKIKERQRQKFNNNRDAINKRRRELRLINRDHINSKQKEYRLRYKNKLSQKILISTSETV
jgi:hypothetical protein